jgi:TRAP-type C4-dicarboxylate transport system permease small subunit
MSLLLRTHRLIVDAMAALAAAILVWLMVSIVATVLIRNAGVQAPAWLFTSAEYGMLYLTMLGAPWLARERGHVHIELLTAALPEASRRLVSRLVALGCVVICAVLFWKGVELVMQNIERRDLDVRAYFTPKWPLTLAFPVSFGLMAVEFARFVFGPRLMHHGAAGIHE